MSLSPSDRRYHAIYEALPEPTRDRINDSFAAVRDALFPPGSPFYWARDDRAEVLVAHITQYLVESNPDHPVIQAAIKAVDES